MSIREYALALLLSVIAAPAVLAQSGPADAVWVGGDLGWISRQVPGTRSRAEVLAELKQFQANPMLADGTIVVGGEQGYVQHRHTYIVRDGVMVHTLPFAATMGINAASPYQRADRRPGSENWEVNPY